MRNYDKLIFVCKSNTSVSPMAEAIMQQAFKLEDILIESRGLVVLFPEPVNPKVEAVLEENGLSSMEHMSCALTEDDFDVRTLVLTMNEKQKEEILRDFEKAQNVWTLAEFTESEELKDPYGGDLSDYGECFSQLKAMTDKLAEAMEREDPTSFEIEDEQPE
ncbi:MAG: phosphotyrosine protein phosphatase [Lachnospiraceae bacterium]|nr:phosphotyrosine protein phosphatase [Lachnospiraceae bacterium]